MGFEDNSLQASDIANISEMLWEPHGKSLPVGMIKNGIKKNISGDVPQSQITEPDKMFLNENGELLKSCGKDLLWI